MCNVRIHHGLGCRQCRVRALDLTWSSLAETGMTPGGMSTVMCKYCNWAFHDGWGELLKYDETYQSMVSGETESTHGFHDEWDDLRNELGI